MAEPNEHHKKVFSEYTRPVVHLRRQLHLKRLGLVFGAGLSKSLGLPTWEELVDKIAADPEVTGDAILKRLTRKPSLPYQTELLFQHFRELERGRFGPTRSESLEFENTVYAKWLKICATHLYSTAPTAFSDALEKHPYLLKLVPIIQKAPLTVTYNFDTYVEQALAANRAPDDDTSRGFETVTNPWNQFRRRSSVIYHPNGVIPKDLMDRPSDQVVFSESSFAKQFMGHLVGDSSFLLNYLSKTTCIIIGSSLEDESLRNLLIQSAHLNPGNCHYCVKYLKDGEIVQPEDRKAITKANFDVYNLITLFANQSEIAALADLINENTFEDGEIQDLANRLKKPKVFRFYVTGPLGVGKTTTTSRLQSLTVLDEWLEPRPEVLAKPWDTLTPVEEKQANTWIYNQFRLKDYALRHANCGVFVVDRPPLDPLAFTAPVGWPTKAKDLLDAICPEGTWPVAEGCVIRLIGEPEELAVRLLATGRDKYTGDKLKAMQSSLEEIYHGDGTVTVDTRGMTVADVTKRVTQIIHFCDYKTYDIDARLKHYRASGGTPVAC